KPAAGREQLPAGRRGTQPLPHRGRHRRFREFVHRQTIGERPSTLERALPRSRSIGPDLRSGSCYRSRPPGKGMAMRSAPLLRPDDPGQVPVNYARVDRHVFGVAPPTLLLALALLACGLAGLLFALGHWLVATACLLGGLACVMLFVSAA